MTPLSRRQVTLSRRVALLLRHRPELAGLTLDEGGWVPVRDLVAALGVSRTELDAVVRGNDKARFAVATGPDGVERIRASQGHSRRVAVDLGLPPAPPPATLFHGTPRVNVASILAEGLRPGRRHHVHLSVDEPTAVVVGRRRGDDVAVLRVAAAAMAVDGYVFHLSANGVWLTETVPSRYLTDD